MEKNKVKALLIKMRTQENEASVNYLLGVIDMMSDEDLITKFEQLNINEENCEQFLSEQIEKIHIQQEQSEHFTNVNKMFCYGRTGNTIHMHLIPKDLRDLKRKLGDEAFYHFFKDYLEDFLYRLQDIFRNDSTITTLFAVSPIFFNPNISLAHENLGFDKIIEVDPENNEDEMSIEQKQFFLSMFNKTDGHKKRVYYTSMSRERLLEKGYSPIPEDEFLLED